jgi:hypothetical protein
MLGELYLIRALAEKSASDGRAQRAVALHRRADRLEQRIRNQST